MKNFHYLFLVFVAIVSMTCTSDDVPISQEGQEWRDYHGQPTGNKYSPLTQINRDNVRQLTVAWTYEMPVHESTSSIKCTPLMADGTIYAVTAVKNLIALNAGTGREQWQLGFRQIDSTGRQGTVRGINYWSNGDDRRIFYVYADHLYAVDADSGQLISSFGENGRVPFDLGLESQPGLRIGLTTPGVIYEDLLITGMLVSERWPAAPGHIRAFNVLSGELEWIFHTVPHPGEYGYETWPQDAYREVGGANNWAGMSLDVERGIVYIPTASPTFDFYGANRLGQNLFANCLLALDAKTGKRLWHFQTIHHDLWDRDLPCAPNLISVRHQGKVRDVVVQPTKQGFFFIFDRETGEPLFEINEVAVPPSVVDGEKAWPTQPIPTWPPPFTRQDYSESLVTNISPEAAAYVHERLPKLGTGLFRPPDTNGIVMQPDFGGGAGWGGAAVDERRKTLVINANDFPGLLQLYDREAEMAVQNLTGSKLYSLHCASCHGKELQGLHFYPPLTAVTNKYSQRELRGILENGVGTMPAFDFLSTRERRAILAFLSGKDQALEQSERSNHKAPGLKYAHRGNNIFEDNQGYPAIKPPWATLTAYDTDSWNIKWQKTLGNHEELTEPGDPLTGTKTLGGPIITAGGLIFIASTADERIRAFDIDTGEMLWEYRLAGPGLATPMTYAWQGKQYVVIAVSGDDEKGIAGRYMAFGLN